jgi:glycosyltransferase involved in cell wall biosynthesis
MKRRLRIGYLAHLPECDFEHYGIAFDKQAAAERIAIGAFSTIEGALLRGFRQVLDADMHVYSFSPFVRDLQEVGVDPSLRLTIIPARPFTGMSTGWIPRAKQLASLLHRNPADIVHGMRNIEGYGLMAVSSNIPHVVTIQEALQGIPVARGFRLPFAVARRVERYVLKRARHLVVLSHHLEKYCRKIGSTGTISVIPNPAAQHFFGSHPAEADRFMFIGRLSPEKGLYDAIEAMLHLQSSGRCAQLTVVGDASGPEGRRHLAACQKLASRLKKPACVEFMGPLQSPAVAPLLRKAYALLMPSSAKYEGMGLVIAEAFASAVPVITYDSGPMPEFVSHGHSGFVVSKGDSQALANAMRQLLTDPKLLMAMKSHAKDAGQRFTMESVCRRYGALFNQIVSSHHNGNP